MMKPLIIALLALPVIAQAQNPSAGQILDRIDANMAAKSRVFTATMIVHATRGERSMDLKCWAEGDQRSFTEYLSPAREKGTKMLKLKDQLWMYTPAADRVIQISGHMLRQSVMGSDLSYEDMMDDRKLTDKYNALVIGADEVDGRACWVLELRAKSEDVSYHQIKMWVDQQRNIPLKEEWYAKGGKLLKQTVLSDVRKVGDRWFPMKITYQDMLKTGGGTEFIIQEIQFGTAIPETRFNKAALR